MGRRNCTPAPKVTRRRKPQAKTPNDMTNYWEKPGEDGAIRGFMSPVTGHLTYMRIFVEEYTDPVECTIEIQGDDPNVTRMPFAFTLQQANAEYEDMAVPVMQGDRILLRVMLRDGGVVPSGWWVCVRCQEQ